MACLNDTVSLADMLCPAPDQALTYFTEIIICDELEIPPQKPDKELITNVLKNFVVTNVEEIEVDLGDGGGIRKKVLVNGTAKLGIEYSADMPEQQVHFVQFDLPFQGIIGYRPCDNTNRGLAPAGFDINNWNIHVCLEHDQYHQLSPRKIKAVIVLLIWLSPKI